LDIIPAIDLRGGRVVRLTQGDPSRETQYSLDPAAVATEWERRGAGRLHLVDLDGAFAGRPANREALGAILRAIRIPAQVGGGLRTLQALEETLGLGAAVAVVGTAALRQPAFLEAACRAFPRRVALAIDARDGLVAASGWTEGSAIRATELAARSRGLPLAAIIYTDIRRDGMRQGPDLEGLAAVADATPAAVIASGGIHTAQDIRALAGLRPGRVVGAIIGKALYDGELTLEAALAAAEAPC
jgi:phosphoribosylformimino-5-aminoimidazole carboxamide ribotide isomerase